MDGSPWQHLMMTVITVAGVAVIMWMEAPAWQREAVTRTARARARRAAAAVARASGRRAMGDELAGRQGDAAVGYGITYRLSLARDRL